MCAIFSVFNHEEAARLTYLGLYALQHRGQESAGIVSMHQNKMIHQIGLGLVGDVFSDNDLTRLAGRMAIGHNRYSTSGENLLSNAQPIKADLASGPMAIAHNGNFVNQDELKDELKSHGSIFQGTADSEVFLHLLAREVSGQDIFAALKSTAERFVGAYSLIIMNKSTIFALRDAMGFRPLVVGQKINEKGEKATIFSSETCALDLIGADLVREVEPGELVWVDEAGLHSITNFLPPVHGREQIKQCIFEHVYFSRPDSVVFGKSVYESRKKFGEVLAKENPVAADVVVPVPDSGTAAALGYSKVSGIPFELGIIRNHYVGRTFIQPQQSIRSFGVKIKLNPQTALLKGKRVIVVDDSLVRGTTSHKIIGLIRAAGAKEVHMRIASPPTTGPCYYGVDTPSQEALIASQKSIPEIAKFIGADSLGYLSIAGLFAALQDSGEIRHFCAACFDGKYPTAKPRPSIGL